ncbi:hypothetical protein MADA3029_140041 [Vibrio nigripulchritudo MADA3029]|nr:hypothetical protein VIBNIMADA3020_130041 [Vibrio nigripulchritudo MADA3020]CCN53439.1 hypothetical protein VIBNIMADA3021_310041 [Vibrio nigripulchritudo MADA3021]CCN58392.1 hypothetical protein MADA3029_140041 [Vibrio nigripulchritudo MADA3029]
MSSFFIQSMEYLGLLEKQKSENGTRGRIRCKTVSKLRSGNVAVIRFIVQD